MWQNCPLCKGTGFDPTPGIYSNIPECPICKGQRIISEITGLPPRKQVDLDELQKKIDYTLVQETEESLKDFIFQQRDNKVPVYKGCPNQQCFCTGACREIIGYRDKLPGEI